MLQIALCDNDAPNCTVVSEYVLATVQDRQAAIRTFSKSKHLLDEIDQKKYAPHIALIEVCMPDINGIALAERINMLLPRCQIIFFTNYLPLALDVYTVKHVYFILRQQFAERISPAMAIALSNLQKAHAQVQVQKQNAFFAIPVSEIQYVEREQRKTKVVTGDDVYLSAKSPSELVGASEHFIRCHQSYWVNLKFVLGMDHQFFLMQCGTRIPISRSYQRQARSLFFRSALTTAAPV